MLRKVHGRSELYLSQAKNAGPPRGHHRRHSFQQAYECEVECCGHATAIVASGELAALKEEITEEAPNAKKSTESFELAEGSKGSS